MPCTRLNWYKCFFVVHVNNPVLRFPPNCWCWMSNCDSIHFITTYTLFVLIIAKLLTHQRRWHLSRFDDGDNMMETKPLSQKELVESNYTYSQVVLSIKWANKAWWWSTNRWIHFSNRIIETMYNDIVMLIVSYIKKTNKTCEPLQRQRIFLNAIYCVLYDGWGKPISPAVKNHKINGKIRCSYLWQRSGCFKWDKIDSYINIRLDSGLALGSSCLNVQCCLVYVKLCSPSCLVYVKLCSQSCLVYIKLWSPSCLVYVNLWSPSCFVYVKPT